MIKNLSAIVLCLTLCLAACGERQPPAQDAQPTQEQPAASSSSSAGSPEAGPLERPGNCDELVALHAELVDWRPFSPVDGVVDYSVARIAERLAEIEAMQARLADIGVQGWPVSQQVDYLTVRAELDEEEFILRVTRPWARDPGFYLSTSLEIAFTDLPAQGETLTTLRQNLAAVPGMLDQARSNLTDVAADNAALAIRSLTQSDGVENGYPYRASPPPGVIGWYEDFLARADAQPELQPEIEAVLASLQSFHDWLVENRDSMDGQTVSARKRSTGSCATRS